MKAKFCKWETVLSDTIELYFYHFEASADGGGGVRFKDGGDQIYRVTVDPETAPILMVDEGDVAGLWTLPGLVSCGSTVCFEKISIFDWLDLSLIGGGAKVWMVSSQDTCCFFVSDNAPSISMV